MSTMIYELGVVEADRSFLETEESTTPTTGTASNNKDGHGQGRGQVGIPWPTWPLKVLPTGSAILELHDLTLSVAL